MQWLLLDRLNSSVVVSAQSAVMAALLLAGTVTILESLGLGDDKRAVATVFAAVMLLNSPADYRRVIGVEWVSRNALFYIIWMFIVWIASSVYSGWGIRSVIFGFMQFSKCALAYTEAGNNALDTVILSGIDAITGLIAYSMFVAASVMKNLAETNEQAWYLCVPLVAVFHAVAVRVSLKVTGCETSSNYASHSRCEEIGLQLFVSLTVVSKFSPSVFGTVWQLTWVALVTGVFISVGVRHQADVFDCAYSIDHAPWSAVVVLAFTRSSDIFSELLATMSMIFTLMVFLCWVEDASEQKGKAVQRAHKPGQVLRLTRCIVGSCLAVMSVST